MPTLFLSRRILFAFIIVFLEASPFLQLALHLASSISLVAFLTHVRPYGENLLNGQELFNEVTLTITSYILILFTDFVEEPETRYMIGWMYSVMVCVNLLVNWVILFSRLLGTVWKSIRPKLKEVCNKKN